jgi:hypothetical protein
MLLAGAPGAWRTPKRPLARSGPPARGYRRSEMEPSSTPSPSTSRRPKEVLLALLASAAVAVIFTWPAVLHPTNILGAPLGEADNHLWMFWKTVEEWKRGAPVANVPTGVPIPLMDPVNLPWYLLGSLADPATGLLTVTLANLVLLGFSTWFLAREWVGPSAAWVALVAAEASPFLGSVVDFGITEAEPLYLLVLHLLFLRRFVLRDQPRPARWRAALLSGVTLGAFALSGWYHAFFGVVLEALLLPWAFSRPGRRLGFLVQSGLALAIVLPAFRHFWAVRTLWANRWTVPHGVPSGSYPLWRTIPISGSDLLNFFLPSANVSGASQSTYLGLCLLFLVLAGFATRWHQLRLLFVPILIFLALTLGLWIRVGGKVLYLEGRAIAGPAWVLTDLLPQLGGLSHWWRALGGAVPLLALAAGAGAAAIAGRRAWIFVPLLLADALFLGNTRFPRTTYDPRPPRIYTMLDGSGAILELPFDDQPMLAGETIVRRYNRWQPFHGHPVAENYEGPDALLSMNVLAATVQDTCTSSTTTPAEGRPASLELAGSLAGLRSAGITWVLLDGQECLAPEQAGQAIDEVLGPPAHQEGPALAWRVPAAPLEQSP